MPAEAAPREANIIDLAHDGRGVADIAGKRVFVPDALPGERVRIQPTRRRRRYDEAQLLEILMPSPDRAEPGCPYFGRCGGCALQHLDPAAQLRAKAGQVAAILERVGRVAPERWLEPIEGPTWHYRRRARLSVRYVAGKGRVLVGFRERGRSYVADMASCRVLARPLDGLIGELAGVIEATSLRQRLSQVEVAVGDAGAALVLRVLDTPTAEDKARFAAFGDAFDVDVLLQPGGPDTVTPLHPRENRPLHYDLPAHDVRVGFAPLDFIQINASVNEQMVSRVIELLRPASDDRVLDLFCGLGNFSLPLGRRAAQVLGVESHAGLVERARDNARRNRLDNVRFVQADLSEPGAAFARERWDLMVLDPPRSGAAQVVDDLRRMAPRAIAYVSCHPATLARDAEQLVHQRGYRLGAVGVLDMFPHTHHVEVMALFERRD